jgi:hypothetical protein
VVVVVVVPTAEVEVLVDIEILFLEKHQEVVVLLKVH